MTSVVMTGGTSGIGAAAARSLAAADDVHVVLGARRPGPAGVPVEPLDLSSMRSIREFASAVRRRVDQIDSLVLNAGIARRDTAGRTPDGFETTFAVNHLGHYLLLRLLMERLTRDAVVVLTTSSTHDPAAGSAMPAPRHADAELLAHPDRDPDLDLDSRRAGGRAYAASKLCSVLTARALAAQPIATTRGVSAVAYDPGPTPGTGLARDGSAALRFASWLFSGPLGRAVPRFSSADVAGRTLADLALGRHRAPSGRVYAALRRGALTWPDPSELALDDDVMTRLWADSARLAVVPDGPATDSKGAK